MRFKIALFTAATLLLALFPALVLQAQPAIPGEALVTAAHGNEVTLDGGANQGMQAGVIFGLSVDGQLHGRVQVTEVHPDTSTATILNVDPEYVVAVGETVKFIAVSPIKAVPPVATQPMAAPPSAPSPMEGAPAAVPPVAPPVQALPPATNPVQPAVPVPPTPSAAPVVVSPQPETNPTHGTMPTTTLTTGANAPLITEIHGREATIGAGTDDGMRSGTTVPVLRNGTVVALLRISIARDDSSSAVVVWHDEGSGPLTVGDTIGVIPAPPAQIVPVATPSGEPALSSESPRGKAVLNEFSDETGLSNAVVSHADKTYDYLAALAAWDYILSQPASTFLDHGVRHEQTEEEITFTRAQIAGFIDEALHSPKMRDIDSKARAALEALTHDYRRELRQLGVSPQLLAEVAPNKEFELGTSGQQSLTYVGGKKTDIIEPYSESQGDEMLKSGYDSQTSYFAQHGDNLRFFATTESSSNTREGLSDSGIILRRGVVSYDADHYIRGLTVDVGRDELWWGPGHFGTMLLSDNFGGLNEIHTTFKRGSYQLEGLYSPLGLGPLGGQRSLYGHNLQVQVSPQLRIGIAETSLAPDTSLQGLQFAAAFLPFPEFTAERLLNRGGSSATSSKNEIDPYIEASIARGVQAYWEYLVADYGVNNQDLVPARVGELIGTHLFTPKDPTHLGMYAEVANLNNRAYLGLMDISDSDYYYHGIPIGYPVAPLDSSVTTTGGALSMRFDTYWRPRKRWKLGGGIEYDDLEAEQANISRQQTYRLRATYEISQKWWVTARARHTSTSQPTFTIDGLPIAQSLFQLELGRAF